MWISNVVQFIFIFVVIIVASLSPQPPNRTVLVFISLDTHTHTHTRTYTYKHLHCAIYNIFIVSVFIGCFIIASLFMSPFAVRSNQLIVQSLCSALLWFSAIILETVSAPQIQIAKLFQFTYFFFTEFSAYLYLPHHFDSMCVCVCKVAVSLLSHSYLHLTTHFIGLRQSWPWAKSSFTKAVSPLSLSPSLSRCCNFLVQAEMRRNCN